MMRILLLTIILLSIHTTVFAQKKGQAFLDSVANNLPNVKADTNKVKLLYKLAFSFQEFDPERGLQYGKEGIKLATSLKWNKGIAASYNSLGINYEVSGKYPEAMNSYFAALKIYESMNDKSGMSGSYNGIGNIYDYQYDFRMAIKNYAKAAELAKEISDKDREANAYNNMGGVYDRMGVKNGYNAAFFDTALQYLSAALKIKKEIGNKFKIASTLNLLGAVAYHKQDYETALQYRLDALKIYEDANVKSRMAICYENIGQVYMQLGKYPEAETYLLKAYDYAAGTGNTETMQLLLRNLGIVYMNTGRPEKALASMDSATIIRDSLVNSKNQKNIMQTQMQYDFDKRTAIQKAEQEKKAAVAKAALVFDLEKKKAAALAEQEKKAAINRAALLYDFETKKNKSKAEQDKKNALATVNIKKQKVIRNFSLCGVGILMLFSLVVYKQRNRVTKERNKSDALLLNILPAEIAEELKHKGESDARLFDNVTVLFTDFVGFTTVSEKLTPKELVDELHACFTEFDAIMTRHKIEKIKTVGDAYLAVCGLPVPNSSHAANTVKAALEIRTFMLKRKGQLGDRTFQIRIGVHSGNVVAGIVGVKKFAYDIWGDTVNTAARMEQNCEPGKVNISESVYELIDNTFTCTFRGKIQAKNKGELSMYYVEA